MWFEFGQPEVRPDVLPPRDHLPLESPAGSCDELAGGAIEVCALSCNQVSTRLTA